MVHPPVYSMDFMSDVLFDGKRFRLLTLVDNYSRKCLAIEAGISIKGENVTEILKNITFEEKAFPERIKIEMVLNLSAKNWIDGLMKRT